MTLATMILRAKSVGVRNFRDAASRFVREHKPIVITERGVPESVLLPYDAVLELVDLLEELNDRELLKDIAEGRRAIRAGAKGIPASEAFRKYKRERA